MHFYIVLTLIVRCVVDSAMKGVQDVAALSLFSMRTFTAVILFLHRELGLKKNGGALTTEKAINFL